MNIIELNARAELLEIELKKIAAINELIGNYIGALADDDNDSTDSAVILAYSDMLEKSLIDAVTINYKIWSECYKPAPVPAETEASVNEAF